jgi:excisionase family DNA binding protein
MTQHQCNIYDFSGSELIDRFNRLESALNHCISLSNSQIEEPEALLTKAQAAKFLQVSHVTLNKLIKEGHLPCHRIGGCTLRIKRSALIKSLVTVRTKSINKTQLGNSS